MMDKAVLTRRLERAKKQLSEKEKLCNGKEAEYTFWGGWDVGYLKGKIATLEDIIDELE